MIVIPGPHNLCLFYFYNLLKINRIFLSPFLRFLGDV